MAVQWNCSQNSHPSAPHSETDRTKGGEECFFELDAHPFTLTLGVLSVARWVNCQPCGRITIVRRPYVEPIQGHNLGRMEHIYPKCRALHWLGEQVQRRGALMFTRCLGWAAVMGVYSSPLHHPHLTFSTTWSFRSHRWGLRSTTARHIGVDLRIPVFSHGWLYVALSRATSSPNVGILLPCDQEGAWTTTCIVYPEVLTEVSDSLIPVYPHPHPYSPGTGGTTFSLHRNFYFLYPI